jgi:hypothetical protein
MGSFVQPARLFVFSSTADKGWGDVLPHTAVVSIVSIPDTIPEHAEAPPADAAALLAPLELSPKGSMGLGVGLSPRVALGLDSVGSGGLPMQRSGSLQRSLVRVPSKPRG